MEVFIGTIMAVGFNFAPVGWALCNGQLIAIQSNAALFSLLGTTYGGDGLKTFGLPNLQGRAPIGVGTGTGLPPYAWGQLGGAASVTLNSAQMPIHNHPAAFAAGASALQASSTVGSTTAPAGNYVANASDPSGGTNALSQYATPAGAAGKLGNLAGLTFSGSVTVGNAGSSQPVPIENPYLAIYYIIATQGIFPSRQ